MISLTTEEINHIMNKAFVIHAKKNLVLIIMIRNIIKSEIIVIIQVNIEVLLIMFLI